MFHFITWNWFIWFRSDRFICLIWLIIELHLGLHSNLFNFHRFEASFRMLVFLDFNQPKNTKFLYFSSETVLAISSKEKRSWEVVHVVVAQHYYHLQPVENSYGLLSMFIISNSSRIIGSRNVLVLNRKFTRVVRANA